jgi:hypothetical protein
MTCTLCRYVLFALLLTCTEHLAKGGSYHMEDRYNPEHIDSLAPENSPLTTETQTPLEIKRLQMRAKN